MAIQVKMWTMESESSTPKFYSKMKVFESETHASLRMRLEEKSAVDWLFDFWDKDDASRIPQKMEDFVDVLGDVFILPMQTEACKRRRLDDDGGGSGLPAQDGGLGFGDEDEDVHILDPVGSSRVTRTSAVTDCLEHQLHSTLLSAEVWQRYLEQAEKMKRDLKCASQEDNRWLLKTSDFNGIGLVKLFCVECRKETGGDSGKHDKASIQNLFNNFKSKHLLSTNHTRNWCAHNDVPYADHPQSIAPKGKSFPLTPEMHQKRIEEGISIMEEVNDSVEDSQKPFSVVQSFKDSAPKSFWMKIRCFYCRDTIALCPPKKNLDTNLRHHLSSSKHVQAVEVAKMPGQGNTALFTGRRGRPSMSSGVSVHSNQPHLGRWWKTDSAASNSNPGESPNLDRNAVLGVLCWGFRGPNCTYAGVSYSVCELLHDPHAGMSWYPEPHIVANFTANGSAVEIKGTFRHRGCRRVDISGAGFANLSCSMCAEIPLENDFHLRVVREERSLEKRGTRGTGLGRRLGYMSVIELGKHGREISKKLKAEKLLHLSACARIVQLKVSRPSLRELAREASSGENNVLKFCHNIINAHRTGAFGGKPALWDFFSDVARNVNRDDRGNRFSDNTKCLAEIMKVYGGRRMVDLFAQNFGGQSYTQVKRDVRKGIQFVAGEHSEIFAKVAQIYADAKVAHNIVGPVPVILAEDETKVKGRVAWEPKSDTLAGFCGPSLNHVCSSGFMPIVGSGKEGYQRLVDSFLNSKAGSFARVVVVNPLHPTLPRLVLVACCTCNCFNSAWVRKQWEKIGSLWKKDCLQAVGPIIGHASDGDSRRRQLMLADYKGCVGFRHLDVGWDGWIFRALLDNNGDASGLHDQDYLHNGTKLINRLLSAARTLQLGGDLCLHSHVEQVFNQFRSEDHGLKLQDIERRDRQNWAAAQRLCQSKVRSCLSRMRAPDYPHPERTLGTEYYLEICASYIDIFCSAKLDLRSRIVLCGKVSFFFRLWRFWFYNGDHGVLGNSQRLVESKIFVSLQCFLDIQLSCHFVVLLICHFRDRFPHLAVPLHLTGSDSCEIFFSRIGGMNGHERAYDFHELVNCANTLNRMSATEYGKNGLAFKKQHNKMDNVWESLHKLEAGEERCNLGDYMLIPDNASVVAALQDGFREAQRMLRALNMAPSTQCQPWKKIWYEKPWVIERADPKSFAYTPSARPVAGEDGDSEVLRDRLQVEATNTTTSRDDPQMRDSADAEDEFVDDGLSHLVIIEEEIRDVVRDLLNSVEEQVSNSQEGTARKIQSTVEVEGHCIYKSTLVSQLNGNNFLSKDRLARIKQSIRFNNHDNCIRAGLSSGAGLLCVGSDCGVYFVQRSTTRVSSTVLSAARKKRGRPSNASGGGRATNILHAVDEGAWWVGRVQAMRRRNGRQFGVLCQPVDLLARMEENGNPKPQNPYIEVMLQYYRKTLGRDKFKYDHTDSKWIDVDCVISTVTMTYSPASEVYSLERNDSELLRKFVSDRNK